jgi:hypothetical protein
LGTQENKKSTIETSNIGYTRQRQRQPEKLAEYGTQDEHKDNPEKLAT